jgi:hypothetical protein
MQATIVLADAVLNSTISHKMEQPQPSSSLPDVPIGGHFPDDGRTANAQASRTSTTNAVPVAGPVVRQYMHSSDASPEQQAPLGGLFDLPSSSSLCHTNREYSGTNLGLLYSQHAQLCSSTTGSLHKHALPGAAEVAPSSTFTLPSLPCGGLPTAPRMPPAATDARRTLANPAVGKLSSRQSREQARSSWDVHSWPHERGRTAAISPSAIILRRLREGAYSTRPREATVAGSSPITAYAPAPKTPPLGALHVGLTGSCLSFPAVSCSQFRSTSSQFHAQQGSSRPLVHWNGLSSNSASPTHDGSQHRQEFVHNEQLRLKMQQLRVLAGHSR